MLAIGLEHVHCRQLTQAQHEVFGTDCHQLFGGWIMSQMDMAAGLVAARHAKGRAVTIAVDAMQFHAPVAVGDEVSVYTEIVKVGRTSMTIEVEAWRRDRFGESVNRVTQARFVFVAIDEHRRPRAIG